MKTIIHLVRKAGRRGDTGLDTTLTAGQLTTAEPTQTEPLAVSIVETCRISGLSRSEVYRCLAAGKLLAVKSGTRTLVLIDSLRQHLGSLPSATFRTPNAGL